jgi:hypothetical protein
MGRKSASGSGIRDEQPGSYFLELRNHFFGFLGVKIHKFFDADPGTGIRDGDSTDPGWKKFGSGIGDKHPGSATLLLRIKSVSDRLSSVPRSRIFSHRSGLRILMAVSQKIVRFFVIFLSLYQPRAIFEIF